MNLGFPDWELQSISHLTTRSTVLKSGYLPDLTVGSIEGLSCQTCHDLAPKIGVISNSSIYAWYVVLVSTL